MSSIVKDLGHRLSMVETMMAVAYLFAKRSTCKRLQVGAVITDLDMRQVLAYGYNGNYAGGPNTCDRDEAGACGCIHAEENALIKLTSPERDLILFTTHSPCVLCAKRIVNQGHIKHIIYAVQYRRSEGLTLLADAGITTQWINDTTH